MIDKSNRKEVIEALAWNINNSGFKASALRSVLSDLLLSVNLPDDEKMLALEDIADVYLAEQRLIDHRAGKTQSVPLEEVIKQYGLED